MINIAVCEDDVLDREIFECVIPKAADHLHVKYTLECYASAETFLEAVRAGRTFNLLIFDILMDEMNGIEAARAAKALLPDAAVGFVTSTRDYAVDAFELGAVHYLMKPIEQKSLEALFVRYMARMDGEEPVVIFESAQRRIVFREKEIIRVESYKKGVAVYLKDKSEPVVVHQTFSSVVGRLDFSVFIQISRGLAVNMDYIERIRQGVCYFNDGTSALLSRKNRNEIKAAYNEYLFEKVKNFKGVDDK